MTSKMLYSVEDVATIVGCSKSHAYKIIEKLNNELVTDNYLIVRGKISKDYFCKRFNLAA
ncbi:MAG: DNA-binding protein [Ruminococcaceae bacterium]|nr:DNA-binding protein [Oscillospiraceae bacterium]